MFWEPFFCLRIDRTIFGNIGPVMFLSSLLIGLFSYKLFDAFNNSLLLSKSCLIDVD